MIIILAKTRFQWSLELFPISALEVRRSSVIPLLSLLPVPPNLAERGTAVYAGRHVKPCDGFL